MWSIWATFYVYVEPVIILSLRLRDFSFIFVAWRIAQTPRQRFAGQRPDDTRLESCYIHICTSFSRVTSASHRDSNTLHIAFMPHFLNTHFEYSVQQFPSSNVLWLQGLSGPQFLLYRFCAMIHATRVKSLICWVKGLTFACNYVYLKIVLLHRHTIVSKSHVIIQVTWDFETIVCPPLPVRYFHFKTIMFLQVANTIFKTCTQVIVQVEILEHMEMEKFTFN